jgi:hypothetical protein
LSLAFIVGTSSFKKGDATYKVDTEASQLKWTGYHLAKSYEHTGLIKLKSGKLTVSKGTITSGEFVADMNSITNTDITDADKNGKLVLCQHGDRRIAMMDAPLDAPQAKFITAAGHYDGQKHSAGARHPVLNFHGFGSLSGNEIGSTRSPIIDEARLIVHQFLDRPGYDSSRPAAANLIKCLGAI